MDGDCILVVRLVPLGARHLLISQGNSFWNETYMFTSVLGANVLRYINERARMSQVQRVKNNNDNDLIYIAYV